MPPTAILAVGLMSELLSSCRLPMTWSGPKISVVFRSVRSPSTKRGEYMFVCWSKMIGPAEYTQFRIPGGALVGPLRRPPAPWP